MFCYCLFVTVGYFGVLRFSVGFMLVLVICLGVFWL